MEMMDKIKYLSEAVSTVVRPITLPIAIKLLKNKEKIPDGAKKTKRDFGHRIAVCQAFNYSRRYGLSVAMLKDDMHCAVAPILFGLEEPPQWWLEGNVALGGRYAETIEVGARIEKAVFRFETNKYIGLVTAPLKTANFEPDLVMIYCNSRQASLLVIAAQYQDGRRLTMSMSGRDSCSEAIVQTMQTEECKLVLPCLGDRLHAGAGDDELIFTVPINKLGTLTKGLTNGLAKREFSPTQMMWLEYERADHYNILAKMIGME